MKLKIEPSVENALILTLFDLANFMIKNGEMMVRDEDLTVQQWLVLLQIAGDTDFPRHGRPERVDSSGILASEIADSRGVSRANISTMVSALLKKELVRQTEDPSDRRRKFLQVTSKGEKVLARVEPGRQAVNADLFSGLSPGELQSVNQLLQSCLKRLWHMNANGDG